MKKYNLLHLTCFILLPFLIINTFNSTISTISPSQLSPQLIISTESIQLLQVLEELTNAPFQNEILEKTINFLKAYQQITQKERATWKKLSRLLNINTTTLKVTYYNNMLPLLKKTKAFKPELIQIHITSLQQTQKRTPTYTKKDLIFIATKYTSYDEFSNKVRARLKLNSQQFASFLRKVQFSKHDFDRINKKTEKIEQNYSIFLYNGNNWISSTVLADAEIEKTLRKNLEMIVKVPNHRQYVQSNVLHRLHRIRVKNYRFYVRYLPEEHCFVLLVAEKKSALVNGTRKLLPTLQQYLVPFNSCKTREDFNSLKGRGDALHPCKTLPSIMVSVKKADTQTQKNSQEKINQYPNKKSTKKSVTPTEIQKQHTPFLEKIHITHSAKTKAKTNTTPDFIIEQINKNTSTNKNSYSKVFALRLFTKFFFHVIKNALILTSVIIPFAISIFLLVTGYYSPVTALVVISSNALISFTKLSQMPVWLLIILSFILGDITSRTGNIMMYAITPLLLLNAWLFGHTAFYLFQQTLTTKIAFNKNLFNYFLSENPLFHKLLPTMMDYSSMKVTNEKDISNFLGIKATEINASASIKLSNPLTFDYLRKVILLATTHFLSTSNRTDHNPIHHTSTSKNKLITTTKRKIAKGMKHNALDLWTLHILSSIDQDKYDSFAKELLKKTWEEKQHIIFSEEENLQERKLHTIYSILQVLSYSQSLRISRAQTDELYYLVKTSTKTKTPIAKKTRKLLAHIRRSKSSRTIDKRIQENMVTQIAA